MTTRRRLTACAVAVAAPLALVGAGGAAASGPPTVAAAAAATGEPVVTRLSDEKRSSRWAYPAREAMIRTAPDDRARVIGRLRIVTEDRLPEVYLLLLRRVGRGEQDWVRLRVPGRPNGRTGWVPRDALGEFHGTNAAITVDRRRLRVTVRRAGRVVFTAPVGIGASSTPTPAGRYWIREKLRVAGGGGSYGPRALGTAAYAPGLTDWPSGGVIGFHGTDQPGLIPGRPSHGCIRLRNQDIMRFYRLVGVGTPLRIR